MESREIICVNYFCKSVVKILTETFQRKKDLFEFMDLEDLIPSRPERLDGGNKWWCSFSSWGARKQKAKPKVGPDITYLCSPT